MNYEVIKKNEYGVLVENTTNKLDCTICKYKELDFDVCIDFCGGEYNKYYLPDQEAAKHETELTPETFTINDMYVTSKQLFDCQDELKASQKDLIDLQIENKQLKERVNDLKNYLDESIRKSGSVLESHAYNNVKEFIKNQK